MSPSPALPNSPEQEARHIHQSGEPKRLLSPGSILNYSAANFGFGAFYALNNFILPLFLGQYTNDARIIGLMSSTDSIEGIVVQPIVGSFSDRLRTRLGRRIPFLLAAIPLSALFILLTPLTAQLPVSIRLVAIIVSIILFTIFYNLARSPYEALMADITPVEQRGRVMATSTLVSLIGQVVLLLLPIPIVPKFGLCALCMVVTTLYTCWRVREPEHPTEAKISHWQELRIALRGLPALPQAGKALFALFLAGLGIGAVFPFLTTFVVKITRSSVHEAESAMVVLMAACALTVLPFGKLTDQIGPKRVLQIGLGLTVLAALGGLWVTQLWHIWVLLAIAGVGNAAQSAARYPLLTEIVPAEEVGFYTGLQNTAMSLALPITSFVTGTLVNQGGYRVIFVVCAINVALAMAVVASVRLRAAAEEVARRNRAMGRS